MYSQFEFIPWVTPFGLFFVTAIFTAWLLARRNAAAVDVDPSHIDLLVPLAVVAGVAGGTLVTMLTAADHAVPGLTLSEGIRVRLFAVLGFSVAGVFAYSRLADLPFWKMLDIFALPTLAALVIHRIGCFLAGCCWGDVVTHGHGAVQGVRFPPGSFPYEQQLAMDLIDPGSLTSLPVHPVQLYEAALVLVLALALWRLPWRRYRQGSVVALSIGCYALVRFLIEYLRADNYTLIGGLSATQCLCLLLVFGTVLLSRWRISVVS
jgi:phosphatidylglycerol:prolipoprotein diacylglycerol transferase